MAKKKNKKGKHVDVKLYHSDRGVVDTNISEYNEDGMFKYGTNVVLARAIPDISDGLKPVERRVLYATAKIAKAARKFTKVLSLVGDVVKIHPHGDSSAENVITSLAKSWEIALPLMEIKGNGGQIAGDEAAAARYINGRVSDYGNDCFFSEWDDKVIDMTPSYNQDYMEPLALAPKYPNVLLKPVTGFTFSMATYIPSYNITEAFEEVIKMIKDPSHEPYLVPDIPSGCDVVDEGNFKSICKTGTGTFKMRGTIIEDEDEHTLTITSLPYQTKLQSIIDSIADFRETKQLVGIRNIYDASDAKGVHLTLQFAKEVDLHQVKMFLYAKTGLEKTFPTQMNFVDNYVVKLFNLKSLIQNWITSRRLFKRKVYTIQLVQLKEIVYITEVLVDIIETPGKAEKIMKMIKKSEDDKLVKLLMDDYNITSVQANKIINLRMSEFSKSALHKFKERLKEAYAKIDEYTELITKPKKLDKCIIAELEKGIEKYGEPRRSRIIKTGNEAKYSDTNHIIVFTKNGYVKKLLDNVKSIGDLAQGDEPVEIIHASNLDSLIFFDRKGYVHALEVGEIKASDKRSYGDALSKYVSVNGDVVAIFTKDAIKDTEAFTFITKKGIIKKTSCSKYPFRMSVASIILGDGDELVSVIKGKEAIDIIAYTKLGNGLRFNTDSFMETNRMSRGVIGIDLPPKDEVVGITKVTDADDEMLILTDKGNGKRCTLSNFASSDRRGTVLKLVSLSSGETLSFVVACNSFSKFKVLLKTDMFDIKATDFPELTRNHPGKKVIPVRRGDVIIKVVRL